MAAPLRTAEPRRVLAGKRVVVIGYGSQGRAQALNLRDSTIEVTVGLRPRSPSRAVAEADGFIVEDLPVAVRGGDVVMTLVPDECQPALVSTVIAPDLKPGAYLGFAHAFAVHFGRLELPDRSNVFLVAPRGPGRLIRRQYLDKVGFACSVAVARDQSDDTWDVARQYACAIGAAAEAIYETTFQQECEADLFGEQAVLCGGLVELIRAGYETLTEAGIAPEMAYFECVQEVKLIGDLIYERGIAGMRAAISNTAKFGGLTRGPRVIGEPTRQAMRAILAEIRSGRFASELLAQESSTAAELDVLERNEAAHPMEAVGQRLRRTLKPTRGD